MTDKPRLLFLFTGGTISMESGDSGHLTVTDAAPNILAHAPVLASVAEVETRSVANVDSSDLTPAHWQDLATIVAESHDDYDGFVIVHGTDTMAFTACALSFMLGGDHKPVVLTGSQRPLRAPRTDARSSSLQGALLLADARRCAKTQRAGHAHTRRAKQGCVTRVLRTTSLLYATGGGAF